MTSPARGPWRIIEHRGPGALEELEPDWRRLYAAMPRRTVFHAFEAHAAYLTHLATEPDRFRCLALSDGHEVRAICPLERRVDRVLGFPAHVWGTPLGPHWPVSDVIGPEDEARRALLPLVRDHLRRRRDGAGLLVLGPLPEHSVLWEAMQELGRAGHCAHIAAEPFVFDCERPFDELMARLSKHFRKQLRNYGNRLASLPDVRFETADAKEGLPSLFDALVDVEASGWKGEQGTGSAIQLDQSRLAFYRQLATAFPDGDGCEINALFADGRCIAAEYCMRTGHSYACLKIGYDEDYARLSPGHLLHARTLERCCLDAQIKRYDQLSEAAWLGVWRPDRTALEQVYVPLEQWPGMALTALLRFRFGTGRRMARWARARSAALRGRLSGPVTPD